ncbi:helix-turn-helix domain-containing protein [Candidatus Allofournierella excrementavium]|uniref:helix-turn-helix domain-containing protein n=1 Tax=Candidatus Allofournierella excrementavium TaxID=2838591 RepID=UPI003AB2B76A
MGKVSDIIDARLHELGIKGSKMCDDLGISRSTLTELRKGRSTTLKAERAILIADYLGISVEELVGNTDQKEKPLVNQDEELTEYLDELKNRPEMRMLFSLTKGAKKEDVEKAVKVIEALLGK